MSLINKIKTFVWDLWCPELKTIPGNISYDWQPYPYEAFAPGDVVIAKVHKHLGPKHSAVVIASERGLVWLRYVDGFDTLVQAWNYETLDPNP
jgi:hypothetical protein